jgi:hypothetical protein
MRDLVLALFHLAVVTAKLCGSGGGWRGSSCWCCVVTLDGLANTRAAIGRGQVVSILNCRREFQTTNVDRLQHGLLVWLPRCHDRAACRKGVHAASPQLLHKLLRRVDEGQHVTRGRVIQHRAVFRDDDIERMDLRKDGD